MNRSQSEDTNRGSAERGSVTRRNVRVFTLLLTIWLFVVLFVAFNTRAAESTNAPAIPNAPAPTNTVASTNPPAATFKIDGYGFLGDLRLKKIIKLLEIQKTKPQFFDANFMEDSALILKSKLREDGYLNPKINIRIIKDDGSRAKYIWS